MSREFFGMKREEFDMGVKEIAKELKEEIKRTEEKLVQLRAMDNIITSMEISNNLKNLPKEVLQNAVPLKNSKKYKRRIKYMQFTDMETRQAMNMWNSMKDIPNINQQTIISKIANTLKYPYKKVYNKVYWLRRTGRIVFPQGMLTGTAKVTKETNPAKNPPFYWSREQKQQLKQLVLQGRRRMEISAIMGIDVKIVSNKVNRMMQSGEIPKVPRNPLIDL
jgi:hypothetical protein